MLATASLAVSNDCALAVVAKRSAMQDSNMHLVVNLDESVMAFSVKTNELASS
jgi:hypothetical protein